MSYVYSILKSIYLFKHSFNEEHYIDFKSTKIIADVENPFVCTRREALEIEILKLIAINKRHKSNIISKYWLLLLESKHLNKLNKIVTDRI